MYDVILQLTYEQLVVQQVKTPKLRAARIKGFYSTCQAIRWELREEQEEDLKDMGTLPGMKLKNW